MRCKKLLSIVISLCVMLALTACGKTPPPLLPEPTATLSVQCATVTRGECNAFVVSIDGAEAYEEIYYRLAPLGEELKLAETSTDTIWVHRFGEVGKFSANATVRIDGKLIASNTVTFEVVTGGGDTMGLSPLGEYPSAYVDLSKDTGDTPSIEHKRVHVWSEEYAYFESVYSDRFFVTTKVDIVTNNYADPYPKSGIFLKNRNERFYFAFDFRPDFSGKDFLFVRNDGNAWLWGSGRIWQLGATNFRNGDERVAVELSVLRDRETLYFAINGEWIDKVVVEGFEAACTVGTLTMSHNTLFSGYRALDGESDEYASILSVLAQTFPSA